MRKHFLCAIADLPDQCEREFVLVLDDKNLSIFVIHQQAKIYSYVNCCPHTGASLNWMPNQFLDIDLTYIQCSTHGALFRIDDGYCVRGPCAGASLQKLNTIIQSGNVYVELPD